MTHLPVRCGCAPTVGFERAQERSIPSTPTRATSCRTCAADQYPRYLPALDPVLVALRPRVDQTGPLTGATLRVRRHPGHTVADGTGEAHDISGEPQGIVLRLIANCRIRPRLAAQHLHAHTGVFAERARAGPRSSNSRPIVWGKPHSGYGHTSSNCATGLRRSASCDGSTPAGSGGRACRGEPRSAGHWACGRAHPESERDRLPAEVVGDGAEPARVRSGG